MKVWQEVAIGTLVIGAAVLVNSWLGWGGIGLAFGGGWLLGTWVGSREGRDR